MRRLVDTAVMLTLVGLDIAACAGLAWLDAVAYVLRVGRE